jgi:putative ABC transport system ATP-binding protein
LSWALSRQLRAEIAERVAGLGMGLEERLDAPIGSLSGGQRQALTLLMATWRVPRLLLLDEPSTALDPLSAAKLMELTRERVERDSITTIMVTHSMQQAVNLGGRVVLMHRGRIVKQWPAGADPAALLLAFEEQRLHEESASETGGTIR